MLDFFFFSRHCNPSGLWPDQLSLSILSRKVFTECRCQRHVKPPNMEHKWLERSNSRHQVSLTSETTQANPSSGRWNYGREMADNFIESDDFHDMGQTALLPLRRKAGWGIFLPKNPTGLNPRTWVPKARPLTSRLPKPLCVRLYFILLYN